jgi:hypothetical protein
LGFFIFPKTFLFIRNSPGHSVAESVEPNEGAQNDHFTTFFAETVPNLWPAVAVQAERSWSRTPAQGPSGVSRRGEPSRRHELAR